MGATGGISLGGAPPGPLGTAPALQKCIAWDGGPQGSSLQGKYVFLPGDTYLAPIGMKICRQSSVHRPTFMGLSTFDGVIFSGLQMEGFKIVFFLHNLSSAYRGLFVTRKRDY